MAYIRGCYIVLISICLVASLILEQKIKNKKSNWHIMTQLDLKIADNYLYLYLAF